MVPRDRQPPAPAKPPSPAPRPPAYTLTSADANKYVRVVVTANDGNGSSTQTAESTRTSIANSAPVNTAVPVVTGTTSVGGTLTAGTGSWTNTDSDVTYTYQWYRSDDGAGTNEAAISGATSASYTPTTSDAHKNLRVVVTASNSQGRTTETASSSRTAVANTAPVNTAAPSVTGTAAVGGTLSAGTGTWSDADSDTLGFTYQWYRVGRQRRHQRDRHHGGDRRHILAVVGGCAQVRPRRRHRQ